MCWQHPLQELLDDLKESCVEDMVDVTVDNKIDLGKIAATLTESYKVNDTVELGPLKFKLEKGCRLLPMAKFHGADLRSKEYLEQRQEMELPVRFMFAHPKPDATDAKFNIMRSM